MINHVSIGVRDIPATKRFYDAILAPLGYSCLSQDAASLGYGRDAVAFWILATEHPVPPDGKSGLHFCFAAPTRGSVDQFHSAALRFGGRDSGRPGIRSDYSPTTMQPSLSTQMGTGSKLIAAVPSSLSPSAPGAAQNQTMFVLRISRLHGGELGTRTVVWEC